MLSFHLQLHLICVKQHQRNIESIHIQQMLHSLINSTALPLNNTNTTCGYQCDFR